MFEQSREPLLCAWLKTAVVCRVIASLGERKVKT